ncbi:MAG: pilin [Patescibacteria group bacterium]|jgi:hypothetical protein
MKLSRPILVFSFVIALIAGTLPVTVHAANPPADEACVSAAKGKAATPPTLYFLPFCDQTPIFTTSDGATFDKYCRPVRSCQADDFVQLFANLSSKALIGLPILALLFFIWAGFNLIMSGGNPEKVNSAKKMMVGVLLGCIIILVLAWMWTTFVVVVLTGDTEKPGSIDGRPWWGTGSTDQEALPTKGCCTTLLGCISNITEAECDEIEASGLYTVHGFSNTDFTEGTACSTLPLCANLKEGCCVPNQTTSTDCQPPDPVRGCTVFTELNVPTHYLQPNAPCTSIAQCTSATIIP